MALPVLKHRGPVTTLFHEGKLFPKCVKIFLCPGFLVAFDPFKHHWVVLKADWGGGKKCTNEKHWICFLLKKSFYKRFSPLFGIFKFLEINDWTSNVFDIDLQDFFYLTAAFAFPFLYFYCYNARAPRVSFACGSWLLFYFILMKAVMKSHHHFKPKNFKYIN